MNNELGGRGTGGKKGKREKGKEERKKRGEREKGKGKKEGREKAFPCKNSQNFYPSPTIRGAPPRRERAKISAKNAEFNSLPKTCLDQLCRTFLSKVISEKLKNKTTF
jgi:hypothetical protein